MPTITPATGPASTEVSVAYITGPAGERVVGAGDGWELMPVGIGTEATIERLVYASLFSDARLDGDLDPGDGTDDRRGWWADALEGPGERTGSLLWWLLRGTPAARDLEDAAREALAWMVRERVCSRIEVTAGVLGRRATLAVSVVLLTGDRVPVTYPDLWSAYG